MTSTKPLYPGLGLPLRTNDCKQTFPVGAHGSCYGSTTVPLPVRELAMMSVMESLTDKSDWYVKVYDETIVAKWRTEALAIPNDHWWNLATSAKRQHWEGDGNVKLIPENTGDWIGIPENIMCASAFDFCIQELRSKAQYFEKTGMVPTLDACASVVKSDTLVSENLHQSLLEAYKILQADQAHSPDSHPNSDDKVQDLVHPSMYPLVYRRTRVFQDEVVGVEDAIAKWSGRGAIIPGEDEWVPTQAERYSYGVGSGQVPPNFWSVKYQWLPSNITFQDDGSVRFKSYINNLHPTKYPGIYRTIEKLIDTSLPMWDQCLKVSTSYDSMDGPGRTEGRFGLPSNADDEEPSNWDPCDPEECSNAEVDGKTLGRYGWDDYYLEAPDGGKEMLTEAKWKAVRKPVQPTPIFQDVHYEPEAGKRLRDQFHKSGLQVIVKMASIELTPEKPNFPQGSWHVEGQMNEHICATALYYLDSENITPSSLSFRMQTSAYLNDMREFDVGQDNYHWMQSIYGTHFGAGAGGACLQNYGSVETREKRLLAFPNVFQHRVSPFELADPTKPGHRRFIALWLVDPHKRIISTANVPPQQLSWWAKSLVGTKTKGNVHNEPTTDLPPEIVNLLQENGAELPPSIREGKLPEELMAMVRENLSSDALPMSLEEAKEHRLSLMKERSSHVQESERSWRQHSYSFCEH